MLQQLYILYGEGRESSITSAETCGKKNTPIIGKPIIACGKAENNPDDQAADHIHSKSAIREMGGKIPGNISGCKVAGYTTCHSSDTDQYYVFSHAYKQFNAAGPLVI